MLAVGQLSVIALEALKLRSAVVQQEHVAANGCQSIYGHTSSGAWRRRGILPTGVRWISWAVLDRGKGIQGVIEGADEGCPRRPRHWPCGDRLASNAGHLPISLF